MVINTLRLCQALNCSPQELDELDPQFVADATRILGYEAELARSK